MSLHARSEDCGGEVALEWRDVSVAYRVGGGGLRLAVGHVDLVVHSGERVAIVGESGSGKSTLGKAAIGLKSGQETSGKILVAGRQVGGRDYPWSRVRGSDVGIIFQDPLTALDPSMRVEAQMTEVARARGASRKETRDEALGFLRAVRISEPEVVLRAYPSQLSGGMRQRVVLATVLMGHPKVVIADEPTTSLDVSTQAEVLDLLYDISVRDHLATVLISHDLSVVAGFADRVVVMYRGEVVEEGGTDQVFGTATHPYTLALLGCVPRVDAAAGVSLATIPGSAVGGGPATDSCSFAERCEWSGVRCLEGHPSLTAGTGHSHRVRCVRFEELTALRRGHGAVAEADPFGIHGAMQLSGRKEEEAAPALCVGVDRPILTVDHIGKQFHLGVGIHAPSLWAVRDFSMAVSRGEAIGIVGETGSGKSTVARCLVGLERLSEGSIRVGDSSGASPRERAVTRAGNGGIQLVFQDPYSSLNPRMTVRGMLMEAMRASGGAAREGGGESERLGELLDMVGLPDWVARAAPGSLSGGERQRVAIARALATRPAVLVCDEATSSLDVSAQAQILNLLQDLRETLSLAIVFITHNIAAVAMLCTRVIVMYRGRIVEEGNLPEIFRQPQADYTRLLLASTPVPDPVVEREKRRERLMLMGQGGLGAALPVSRVK